MFTRLFRYWVYGGFPAGIMLLALLPLLTDGWPLVLIATFVQLPIYMVHQFEEHDNDRFRRFVNALLGDGLEILSPTAVWVVNVPGVWGVNVVALYLASAVDPGLGLISIYLVLVNAAVHIAGAIRLKEYNPGLATAVTLFLPTGIFGIWAVQRSHYGTSTNHIIGLGIAVLIHIAIVVYALARKGVLQKASKNS